MQPVNVSEMEKKQMLTIREWVEGVCDKIIKSGKAYGYLSFIEKAEFFQFEFDNITDNLKLHTQILARLGMEYSGAEIFEDCQEIYDEMVKREKREDRRE